MDDAAFALACAMLIDPDLAAQAQANGPIALPEIQQTDDWYLSSTNQTDRLGNFLPETNRVGATYTWTPKGLMTIPSDARKEWLAHEMGHHLQNLAQMNPGRSGSKQREQIEAQAYAIEEQTPAQCRTFWGNWDTDKLGPLARKLTEGAQ